MISVIIADDHAVVRTGLHFIFQDCTGIAVKAEADSGDKLLSILQNNTFDAAIVDMNMPGISSLDLIARLRDDYPKLPVVVFTMNADDKWAVRSFKSGALAYINKEENPDELIRAVKSVVKYKRYLTPRQESLFANRFIVGVDGVVDHEGLTDREYQVMCMLADGMTKTDIAHKLQISKNTISNHRNNILKKLNLANNVALTKYALSHQIIL
ncbi:response regulator [Saccharicrinis fermentans]|uniref:Response regulator UvrY n=1 Tax=Saccharicrinis fermentans DSM 9555 = JCM 21142 TaxID=869213 RepID=W7YJD2_9BACT|nr:response regulator transcription factor [Saccharicrinis fermentans]GAF04611.1 response regulator UvrY [Saccharicrinis fermentans DSM 9555 = JCM 21142]